MSTPAACQPYISTWFSVVPRPQSGSSTRSRSVEHPAGAAGGEHGDVEQELGEQLVGLARVLQDRQQVVVEAVQPLGAPPAGRRRRRSARTARTRWRRWRRGPAPSVVEVAVERHVLDTRRPSPESPRRAVPSSTVSAEHAELGDGESGRGAGVDPVRGRRHEQRVRAHGGRDYGRFARSCLRPCPSRRFSAKERLMPEVDRRRFLQLAGGSAAMTVLSSSIARGRVDPGVPPHRLARATSSTSSS